MPCNIKTPKIVLISDFLEFYVVKFNKKIKKNNLHFFVIFWKIDFWFLYPSKTFKNAKNWHFGRAHFLAYFENLGAHFCIFELVTLVVVQCDQISWFRAKVALCEDGSHAIFFASRGALRNHSPSAQTSPSSGKPLPLFDFRRGMGMDLGSKLAESWWGCTDIWTPDLLHESQEC